MGRKKTDVSIGRYNRPLIEPAEGDFPESRLFRISRFNRNWVFTLFIPPAVLPLSLIGDEWGFANRFFWMQMVCSFLQFAFWAVVSNEMMKNDVWMLEHRDVVGQNREVDRNRRYLFSALALTLITDLMIIVCSGFERFWCPLLGFLFSVWMFASAYSDCCAVRHLRWDRDVLRPADITDRDLSSSGFPGKWVELVEKVNAMQLSRYRRSRSRMLSVDDSDDGTLDDDNYYYRQQQGRSNADVNAPFEGYAREDDAFHDWVCGHEDLDSGNHRDCW